MDGNTVSIPVAVQLKLFIHDCTIPSNCHNCQS